MNYETYIKRLEKIENSVGRINERERMFIVQVRKSNGRPIEVNRYSGSGRYTKIVSIVPLDRVEKIMNVLGLDYEHANIAPRGGKIGEVVILSKKSVAKLKPVNDYINELQEKNRKERNERIEAHNLKIQEAKKESVKLFEQKATELYDELLPFYTEYKLHRENSDSIKKNAVCKIMIFKVANNDFSVLKFKEIKDVIFSTILKIKHENNN